MKNQRVARSAVLPCLAALIPTVVVGAAALAVSAPSGGSARPARALQAVVAPVRAALAPAAPASTPLQLADFTGFGTASPLHHPNSVFQVRTRIALPHAGTGTVPLALVPFGTGDVIRITNASGQTVRAPQSATDTSIAPNQPLTFTVQLNNNNANTAANVQSVYLQFKDPDSLYQDTNISGAPREHKVFTEDTTDYNNANTSYTTRTDSGSASTELYNGHDGMPAQVFSSKEGTFDEFQRGAIGGDDSTSFLTVGRVDNVTQTVTESPGQISGGFNSTDTLVSGGTISGGTTTGTTDPRTHITTPITTTGGTVTGGMTTNGVTTGATVTGGTTTGGTTTSISGGVTITTTGGTTTNATITGGVTTTTNGVTTTTGGTGTGGVTMGGTSTATFNFQDTNNPIYVTDGTNTHQLNALSIDTYDFPLAAENAFHPWGQEYECQYLNAQDNGQSTPGNPSGYTGTADASDADYGTPYYLAGYDDQYQNPFPSRTVFSNGMTTTVPAPRPEWLALNPVAGQTNQYQATWSPPASPSDFYVDVIVSYTASDTTNGTTTTNSHWRIFDNVWGFSTLPFDPAAATTKDILVVSDNALGQKFGASAPNGAGLVNLRPSFYGAESYYTDYDVTRLPNATEYFVAPLNGRKPQVGFGNAQVNLDDQRPVEFIQPLGQSFDEAGAVNAGFGFAEGQVFNGLGYGSYDFDAQEQILLNDPVVSREHVTVNGVSIPRSQAYSLWRILSRGRVPQTVYQAFEPTFQSQPAVNDPATKFSAPAADGSTGANPKVTVATRCILWVSPFAGDEPLNVSGSITDSAVQGDLRAYVNAGGRLMVSGQEVASAITLNGAANNGAGSFVSDVLNATLKTVGNNSFNNQTQMAATGIRNQVTYDSLLNVGGGNGTNSFFSSFEEFDGDGSSAFYQPPGNTSPFYLGNNYGNGNQRTDGALTQLGPVAVGIGTSVIQGQINSVNPQNGAIDEIANPDGASLVYRNNYTPPPAGQTSGNGYGSRVVFASFGLEGLGIEYYRKNADHNYFYPRNDRPNILHNIVSYLRSATFQGTIFQGTGTNTVVPGATVYLTTSGGTILPGGRQTYSAITAADGTYLIQGVEPGIYRVNAYKYGFTESQSDLNDPNGKRYAVEGDTTDTINLNISPLPPGIINGTVKVSNGLGAAVAAPLGTPVNFVSTTGGPTASGVTIDSSGDYSVTANVGTYNGTATTTSPPASETINGIKVPQNTDGTAGTVTVNFVLTLNPSHISGGVTLNGQGVGGATVFFNPVPASAGTVQTAISNSAAPVGGYTSPGLPAGTYSVTATATIGGVSYAGQAAANVTVTAGNSIGGVNVALQAAQTATLSGTVTDNTASHAPIRSVTITTQGPAGTLTAATDTNGAYSLSVPQGTYTVTASKTGFTSQSQTVTIPTAQTTGTLNFTLTALTSNTASLAAGHYNLVSWPYEDDMPQPGSPSVFSDIFGSLISAANPNGNRGPAFVYDSGGLFQALHQHYVVEPAIPADALHLGRGYFVYISTVVPQFTLFGTPPSGPTASVALQGGNGLDGWNMIGVPSTTPISVANLHFQIGSVSAKYSDAVAAGYIYPTVYGYNPNITVGSPYSAVTQMQPFQGYWVRAKISGLTIQIPTSGG